MVQWTLVLRQTALLVAPHLSVAHGLSYTLSNCMRHKRAKRVWLTALSVVWQWSHQKSRAPLIWSSDEGSIILHGPKVWCMVSCTTPVSQSECRDSGSTGTKGNKTVYLLDLLGNPASLLVGTGTSIWIYMTFHYLMSGQILDFIPYFAVLNSQSSLRWRYAVGWAGFFFWECRNCPLF